MNNISPPVESPLRSLKETPLRALKTPPINPILGNGWNFEAKANGEEWFSWGEKPLQGSTLLPPYNDGTWAGMLNDVWIAGGPPAPDSNNLILIPGSGWEIVPLNQLFDPNDSGNGLAGRYGSDLSCVLRLNQTFIAGRYAGSAKVYCLYERANRDDSAPEGTVTLPQVPGVSASVRMTVQIVKADLSQTVDVTPADGVNGAQVAGVPVYFHSGALFGDDSDFYPQITISSPVDPQISAADAGIFAYSPEWTMGFVPP